MKKAKALTHKKPYSGHEARGQGEATNNTKAHRLFNHPTDVKLLFRELNTHPSQVSFKAYI